MADMKFLHLSDLHLGKRVNEYSMLEDQEDILAKILEIVEKECPDGVLIAGDIYDKPVPGAETVQIFDNFLDRKSTRLNSSHRVAAFRSQIGRAHV